MRPANQCLDPGHKLRPCDRSRSREIGCAACAMMSMSERRVAQQATRPPPPVSRRRRVSTHDGALLRSLFSAKIDRSRFLVHFRNTSIAFRKSCALTVWSIDRRRLRVDALHPKPGIVTCINELPVCWGREERLLRSSELLLDRSAAACLWAVGYDSSASSLTVSKSATANNAPTISIDLGKGGSTASNLVPVWLGCVPR